MARKFQGVDFYNIETLLSVDERILRNGLRDMLNDKDSREIARLSRSILGSAGITTNHSPMPHSQNL